MVDGADVLHYLIPTGGWVIYENDFNSIIYDENVKPITKKQFEDAFEIVEKIKQKEKLEIEKRKSILLEKLGITEEEAKLLLS